jgi:hypothetical protein
MKATTSNGRGSFTTRTDESNTERLRRAHLRAVVIAHSQRATRQRRRERILARRSG